MVGLGNGGEEGGGICWFGADQYSLKRYWTTKLEGEVEGLPDSQFYSIKPSGAPYLEPLREDLGGQSIGDSNKESEEWPLKSEQLWVELLSCWAIGFKVHFHGKYEKLVLFLLLMN